MGDSNFYIENNRLKKFYERAEKVVAKDFARQECIKNEYITPTRLSMDFPKQAVETLSKIADDEGFPLQEMSDKEILSLGVFLHNVGSLFYHEGELGESQTKLSEEVADMDNSALKDFYKGVLSTDKGIGDDYDVIKDKENRKNIAEFIYHIVDKDICFIIYKVSSGAVTLGQHESIPPGALKFFKPSSEWAVRNSLLNHIFNNIKTTLTEGEQLRYIVDNSVNLCLLKEERARFDAGLSKRGAFKRFYNNL